MSTLSETPTKPRSKNKPEPDTNPFMLLPPKERLVLVRERLGSLRRPSLKSLPKPKKVLAAEKIIEEWQEKNSQHRDAQRAAYRTKYNEIVDSLIRGDMALAATLLRDLEKSFPSDD